MQDYQSIAVAGTHGKTTTSSLIGYLLLQAGLDPTIVVGGEVKAWEGNARMGEGPYLVAEADESDGSLVKFAAQIGVITNIELDHPDHYKTLDQVVDIFKTFADRCQTVIGCLDCPTVRQRIFGETQAQTVVSYSLQPDSGADYVAANVTYSSDGTTAQIWERGQFLGELHLKLLGQHNLSNALAAVAVGRLLDLEFATIASAIASFEGARRRFECRGEYGGIRFIDDYAHHPSEIQATLKAARLQLERSETDSYRHRRVVAVFQPHRYSRTLAFLSEFSQAFAAADTVIVTDIYSAGEPDQGLISGTQLAEAIAGYHQDVYYKPLLQAVAEFLKVSLHAGDLVIFLGAGNLNQIISEVMSHYQLEASRRQGINLSVSENFPSVEAEAIQEVAMP
jgi:UDP-N-acetylmuramate--alanine ligase